MVSEVKIHKIGKKNTKIAVAVIGNGLEQRKIEFSCTEEFREEQENSTRLEFRNRCQSLAIPLIVWNFAIVVKNCVVINSIGIIVCFE